MTPSGKFTLIFFRLCSFAPTTFSQPVGFLRSDGTGIFSSPLKYFPVMEFGFFIRSSAVPIAPALRRAHRSRADIDNAVSGAHRILVVLHDDQAVSEVTQMFQRREKFVVVSLVKTDARLVENIGDTDKAGADLRCQTDSLRLTAGQRCSSARQGQIV